MAASSIEVLIEFVSARCDDAAKRAHRLRGLADTIGQVYGSPEPSEGSTSPADQAYFTMHDEADRLLAEVNSKRTVLDRITRNASEPGMDSAALVVLRLLAMQDSGHPDFPRKLRPSEPRSE